jgi:hypothetical protein
LIGLAESFHAFQAFVGGILAGDGIDGGLLKFLC